MRCRACMMFQILHFLLFRQIVLFLKARRPNASERKSKS